MKLAHKLLCGVAAAAVIVLSSSAMAQTVVTFDDLTGQGVLADGYGGITWGGEWSYYDANQNPYNPASGLERIYSYTQNASFSFASAVQFDGAYVAGAPFGPGGLTTVAFELFDSGTLVDTVSLNPSSTPTFLATNYSGLVTDVVVIATPGYFVLDNVTYTGASTPAPEPASLAALGMGLVAVGLVRRRRV